MAKKPTAQADRRLVNLIARHAALLARREPLANQLQELDQSLRELEENELPELFAELGLQDAALPDGTNLKLANNLSASVAARNQAQARGILKRIGALGIAQTQVIFAFSTEQFAKAAKDLLQFARIHKLPSEQKDVMNTTTLKAVVRDALEGGKLQPADLEILGVWITRKVSIKYPKEAV